MKVKRLSSSSRLPRWGDGTESACQCIAARDTCSIPGLERSPGAGNGNLLQYSCLENPMDRGAWWATVCGVTESQTWLSGCGWAQHILTAVRRSLIGVSICIYLIMSNVGKLFMSLLDMYMFFFFFFRNTWLTIFNVNSKNAGDSQS